MLTDLDDQDTFSFRNWDPSIWVSIVVPCQFNRQRSLENNHACSDEHTSYCANKIESKQAHHLNPYKCMLYRSPIAKCINDFRRL